MGYIQCFIKEGHFSHFDLIFARTYATYFGLPEKAVKRYNLWEDLEGKQGNELSLHTVFCPFVFP